MARPPKSGLEYFPLDVDFFEDEKIIAISREHGVMGEAVLLRLLCAVFRRGYFAVWGDGLREKLLRSAPGLKPGHLEQIVKSLVKWDVFDARLFREANVLTSKGIQRRYFAATKRRQTGENMEYLLVNVDNNPDGVSVYNNPRNDRVSVCNNPQRKEENIKLENAAAAPACAYVREPEESPREPLPAYAETVISSDCLERFRAYCEAWNAVVGKPRIPPDIPHYAEMFAMTEYCCKDTTIFTQTIEHLRKHPQSVVCTGKISLKITTIFSVDFVTNVVAGGYDTDFSQKQQTSEKRRGKHGGRYRPNPEDYTGVF